MFKPRSVVGTGGGGVLRAWPFHCSARRLRRWLLATSSAACTRSVLAAGKAFCSADQARLFVRHSVNVTRWRRTCGRGGAGVLSLPVPSNGAATWFCARKHEVAMRRYSFITGFLPVHSKNVWHFCCALSLLCRSPPGLLCLRSSSCGAMTPALLQNISRGRRHSRLVNASATTRFSKARHSFSLPETGGVRTAAHIITRTFAARICWTRAMHGRIVPAADSLAYCRAAAWRRV